MTPVHTVGFADPSSYFRGTSRELLGTKTSYQPTFRQAFYVETSSSSSLTSNLLKSDQLLTTHRSPSTGNVETSLDCVEADACNSAEVSHRGDNGTRQAFEGLSSCTSILGDV